MPDDVQYIEAIIDIIITRIQSMPRGAFPVSRSKFHQPPQKKSKKREPRLRGLPQQGGDEDGGAQDRAARGYGDQAWAVNQLQNKCPKTTELSLSAFGMDSKA